MLQETFLSLSDEKKHKKWKRRNQKKQNLKKKYEEKGILVLISMYLHFCYN